MWLAAAQSDTPEEEPTIAEEVDVPPEAPEETPADLPPEAPEETEVPEVSEAPEVPEVPEVVETPEVVEAPTLAAPTARKLDAQDDLALQPKHRCKVESEEALKLLGTGTQYQNTWSYGSWVYSNLGERSVKNGIAECKLLCDEDENCQRWVYSCETRSCRYHGYGGSPHDEDNQYSFLGEAEDIGAKINKALEYERAAAASKAQEEEAERQRREADRLAEANAAAKAQADVAAAQAIAAQMRNRRLSAAQATSIPAPEGASEAEEL